MKLSLVRNKTIIGLKFHRKIQHIHQSTVRNKTIIGLKLTAETEWNRFGAG